MNWFRFYHDVLDDPKVQRLDPPLFKAWVNLLCLASKADDRGHLPTVEDIAFALRVTEAEATDVVLKLNERGLIDGDWSELVIHNWTSRQKASDNVTERVRKHRSGPTNTETFHGTDTKRSGNGLEKRRVERETEQRRGDEKPRAGARELGVSPPPRPAPPQPKLNEPPPNEGPAPFEYLLALCEATGTDVSELSESVKRRQEGVARHLRGAGMTPDDVRRCAGWLRSQTWRTNGISLETIEKERPAWELAGKPATATQPSNGRASPATRAPQSTPFERSMAAVDEVFGRQRPPDETIFETTGVVQT